MPVDDRTLRLRRVKRQLKAGASIVLAIAAGAFLACQRTQPTPERSPMGPDARSGPAPADASPDAVREAPHDAAHDTANDAANDAAHDTADDTADATHDASALAVDASHDAGAIVHHDPSHARRHRVDRDEHRRGLPVLDNLLE